MRCLVCADREVHEGLLCSACATRLKTDQPLCAEQITCLVDGRIENAGLMDEWGRFHTLAKMTPVRRPALPGGISIAEPSVSRAHAELHHGDSGWVVRDLDSSNGTRVNGKRVDAERLAHGDVVAFGNVSFLFVNGVSPTRDIVSSRFLEGAPPQIYDDDVIEETFSGLRPADVTFVTPSGGGGGVLAIDGRNVQLTLIQLELFQVLAKRMIDEVGSDERVRGFVRSSELLATLAWDTPKPEDNHMKQLVRRVRRALSRAGIPDIIHSRHGFGYRLCVLPMQRD